MRISDWSSDVCSSDLAAGETPVREAAMIAAEAETGIVAIEPEVAASHEEPAVEEKPKPATRRRPRARKGEADQAAPSPAATATVPNEEAPAPAPAPDPAAEEKPKKPRRASRDRKSTRLNSSH